MHGALHLLKTFLARRVSVTINTRETDSRGSVDSHQCRLVGDHTARRAAESDKVTAIFLINVCRPSRLHRLSRNILCKRFDRYVFIDSQTFDEMFLFNKIILRHVQF